MNSQNLTDEQIMEICDNFLSSSSGNDHYDYISKKHWYGDRN
jgi:hypothetical protein